MDLGNLSESDAQTIVSDSSNEFHERLYSGDATIKAAVERAYAKANPERDAQIRESKQADAWIGAAPNPEDGAPDAAPADPMANYQETPSETQVMSALRTEWGDQFRTNMEIGGSALVQMFPNPVDFHAFVQASDILNDGPLLDRVMRIAVDLGNRMRRNR